MKMETKQIALAIKNVMEEISGVAKNMTVGSGNNSYKGVADKDVKQAIRESMIKNGLSILPIGGTPKIQIDRWEEVDSYSKETPKAMKTKQSIFTEIETKYLLLHTSGESIEVYGYGQGVDTQDKGAGKATTYALKNTLLNMFLIPTGVDTDNTHSDEYDVPKKVNNTQTKKWLNYESFIEIVNAGNTSKEDIWKIIKEDGFTLSGAGTEAIKYYLETGDLGKDLKNMFFKK